MLLVTLLFAFTGIMVAGETLEDFTFYMTGAAGVTLQIEADIYAWNGSLIAGNPIQGAYGPAFYQSPLFTYTASGGIDAVTVYPNVTLPAGHYVALFTISNPLGYYNSNGTVSWLLVYGSHPAGDGGGGFNWANTNSCYACVNNGDWSDSPGSWFDFGDAVWTAHFASGLTFDNTAYWNSYVSPFGFPDTATYGQTFSTIPEPGTMILLGSGLLGLAGRLRRRR